jgi:ubiquinone/menaquinone biosynthesis C-methylase UbiE/uncharacterized protein YbaR (Trm112 family)
MVVKVTDEKRVHFAGVFDRARCETNCSLKQCSVNEVTPSDCIECYSHEILEGVISCGCGQEWPVIDGVPRFLPKALAPDIRKTQSTFSFEWKLFRFGERNWAQDIDYRKSLFLKALGAEPTELKDKVIFDAGCGSGLLSMEMAESFGMEVIALDLAFGIEKAYERNSNPFVHFLQGSILEPPVRDRVFDYVYCAGVLVACPSTREGLTAIVRSLKHGGRCFIWLYHPIDRTYHPHDWRKLAIYNWIRKNFTSRLPIRLQYLLYLSLMPPFLLKQSVKKLLGCRQNQLTWREKMQALFDFFSPIYQHRHTPAEAVEWFRQEGFADSQVSYQERFGFGVRGNLATDVSTPVPMFRQHLKESARARATER